MLHEFKNVNISFRKSGHRDLQYVKSGTLINFVDELKIYDERKCRTHFINVKTYDASYMYYSLNILNFIKHVFSFR